MIIRVCVAAALLTPAAAMAQGNPGPYGKLFGRAPATSADWRAHDGEGACSIGANYDDALLAPEGSPADTERRPVYRQWQRIWWACTCFVRSVAANLSAGASRGGRVSTQPSGQTRIDFASAGLTPISPRD